MNRYLTLIFVNCVTLIMAGCAAKIDPNYDAPVVSLHTFRPLPQQGVTPIFEIGLSVLNPNREPLKLEGIYYTVAIEGHQVVAGVTSDLPTIAPYSQADVTLLGNVDVIGGISFIASLINDPREVFSFSFSAKLDPGGFNRKILIEEKGEFSFRN